MSDAAEATTEQVRANGIDFECLRWGDGDRLALCLHGFPDDPGTMGPLAARLVDAGFTVVAPYMRGYGPTGPAPDGRYSPGALGQDALALADALEGDGFDADPVLVGHDWGAVATYVAATIDPDRFSHVVAMAVPPRFTGKLQNNPRQWLRSWYMGFFQLPWLPERALRAVDFALVEALWATWSPGWQYPESRMESVKETVGTGDTVESALAYYRQTELEDGDDDPGPGIGTPGLLLTGERDGCIGAELFRDADDAFDARCRVVKVREAGHFLHQERVDVVADEITRFVAEG